MAHNGKSQVREIKDPYLQAAFAARNAELKQLLRIDHAIRERNTFLDTQPVGRASDQ